MDWDGLEAMHLAQDLPPAVPAVTSRTPVPVYARRRQVGRVTSTTWSPILKKAIALASVNEPNAASGSALQVEWTVEARRGRVDAVVVDLPFFNPPRKTEVISPA